MRRKKLMEKQREVFVPQIDPASIPGPSREIHGLMGRDNIYRMLEDFYRELGASAVRGLFPKDLLMSSQKSAAFFVQLLGGPPEYSERHGPPRMRARHMPFRITRSARGVWLACFERILDRATADYSFPEEHLAGFRQFLQAFSLWMVNTKDE
jgi:hemoglobin